MIPRVGLIPRLLLFLSTQCALGQVVQAPDASVTFTPSSRGSVTVPLRNVLDLDGSVNGQAPIAILFDTGSSSLMSGRLARRLGLKVEGHSVVNGFGSQTVDGQAALVETLRIGELTLHNVLFMVFDQPIAGAEEYAVLGDQLLKHLVVTLDMEHKKLTFTDPNQFHYSGVARAIPVRTDNNGVEIQAAADGYAGTFGVDTGDAWSLTLLAGFVKEHDLIQHYGAKFEGYGGSGVGGPDHAFYTRVHTLRLGSAEVHEPVTFLYTDTPDGSNKSSFAGKLAGNIGQRVLRQFTETFDVPHGSMYLEPNGLYGKPDIFNRAGLVLDAGDDSSVVVKTALPGGPGAVAGIVEGDRILAIDGHPLPQPHDVTAFNEVAGAESFRQPVGTVLRLRIRHGDTERTVSVTLRDVL